MADISLAEILKGDEFLEKLQAAAAMPYDIAKPPAFYVISEGAGSKATIINSGEIESGERIVYVHFHHPKASVHPSYYDILDLINAKYRNQETSAKIVTDIFTNPVSIIGIKRPYNPIELLVLNLKLDVSHDSAIFNYTMRNFFKGQYSDTEIFEKKIYYTTQEVTDHLTQTGHFQAISIDVRNGRITRPNMKKLENFGLIEFPSPTGAVYIR